MFDTVHLLRSLHGYTGVLAAAALLHPVVTLPRRGPLRRGTRWAVGASTALAVTAFSAGWALYPGYRTGTKRELLGQAPVLARAFETKEHVAFYVVVLAVAGLGLALRAPDAEGLRAARWCYGLAGVLAIGVIGLGVTVGAWR